MSGRCASAFVCACVCIASAISAASSDNARSTGITPAINRASICETKSCVDVFFFMSPIYHTHTPLYTRRETNTISPSPFRYRVSRGLTRSNHTVSDLLTVSRSSASTFLHVRNSPVSTRVNPLPGLNQTSCNHLPDSPPSPSPLPSPPQTQQSCHAFSFLLTMLRYWIRNNKVQRNTHGDSSAILYISPTPKLISIISLPPKKRKEGNPQASPSHCN